MSETNGKTHAANTEVTVDDKVSGDTAVVKSSRKKKSEADVTKRVKSCRLRIDAGNGRIKFESGGYFGVIKSMLSLLASPQTTLGAYELDGQHWLVGADAETVGGSRIEIGTTPGAKVNYFPHMVLGAITSHPSILSKATRVDGNKTHKQLIVDVDCLALASGEELFKLLKKVKSFSKDGINYGIEWRNLIAYPEGYGAAISAHNQIKKLDPKAKQFHILDIGNGTVTLTPYNCFGKTPLAGIPKTGSGGGVVAIIDKFSETANTGDHETIYLDQLRKALERSKILEDGNYQAIVAGTRKDLGSCLKSALFDWKDRHPATKRVLRQVDDALLDGDYVFCCGGGFEIPPIADFIKAQFPNSDRLTILEKPGTISLEGLNNASTKTKTN